MFWQEVLLIHPWREDLPGIKWEKKCSSRLGRLGRCQNMFCEAKPPAASCLGFPQYQLWSHCVCGVETRSIPLALMGRTISSQPDECIFRSKAQGLTSPPMTMPDAVLISAQARSNGFSHRRLSDQGTPHLETCSTLHLPLLYSKLFCIQLNYNIIEEKGPKTKPTANPHLITHGHFCTGIKISL